MQGDLRTAQVCYLVRIRPLMEWTNEKELGDLQVTGKKPRTGPPPVPSPAAEALVIHALASTEPDRPCLEAVEDVE